MVNLKLSRAAKKRVKKMGPNYMSELGKKRQAKLSPEERTLMAIKLNEIRWKKNTQSTASSVTE